MKNCTYVHIETSTWRVNSKYFYKVLKVKWLRRNRVATRNVTDEVLDTEPIKKKNLSLGTRWKLKLESQHNSVILPLWGSRAQTLPLATCTYLGKRGSTCIFLIMPLKSSWSQTGLSAAPHQPPGHALCQTGTPTCSTAAQELDIFLSSRP